MRCLAKAPDERFHSVADLLAAFVKAQGQTEGHPAKEGPQAQSFPALEKRVAAILWTKTRAPVTELLPSIQAEGGVLSRVLSNQYLFCFLEKTSPEQGLRAAIRAARSLSSRSPTDLFIVDVASVRFHSGASHLGAMASPVRSETSASSNQMGSFVTPRAAQLLDSQQTDNVGAELIPIQQLTAVELPEIEGFNFHGRMPLLQELEREAQEAWSRHTPTLTAVIGEPGYGKTRILTELSTRLSRLPGVQLLRIEAGADPEQSATLRSLLRGCLGLPASALTAAEVHEKCESWLASSERKEELWRAVAVTLGGSSEAGLDTAQQLSIPGETRHLVAKAIALALQHRCKLGPVAVLLDDAHLADPSTLDALEIATLEEGNLPLLILITALPALDSLRPFLGDRSGARFRHSIGPLEPAAARALLLELLRPVDFVPESVLAHLEQSAQGVPRLLVEVVHALRLSGAIRAQPGKTAWYIAADELLHSSATPLYQRLAKRILLSLSTPLQALASLCAVIGKDVDLEEVRGVQLVLATSAGTHGIDSGLDPRIGLERLAHAGLIKHVGGNKFEFGHPQLQQAMESLTSPTVRLQLHRAIYQFHSSRSSSNVSLPKLARHAAACGARAQAFDAYSQLAELARREHRYVEADQFYTAAQGHLGEADEEPRCRVLSGRGKVRYRMQRFNDAVSDLVSARKIAEQSGNLLQRLDLLLEEATVWDWLGEYQHSSELTDAAVALSKQVDDSVLAARCQLAQGRQYFRIDQHSKAEEALRRAASQAKTLHDDECLTIALLLKGLTLAFLDRYDDSEEDFQQVIKLAESRGDHFHLGTAYINRVFLWVKRGSIHRAVADLQQAIHLSRELGYVQIERTASYNLAECLHWMGRDNEALPLALRADELMRRFFSDHPQPDALLVVRILATQGNLDEARKHLARLEASSAADRFGANLRVLHRLAKLLVHRPQTIDEATEEDGKDVWSQLVEDARTCCIHDEIMEVLWHAARVALRSNHPSKAVVWLKELQEGLERSPLWQGPLESLTKLCPPKLQV
jgi:tetratricopeptide (TPR) repeat protein